MSVYKCKLHDSFNFTVKRLKYVVFHYFFIWIIGNNDCLTYCCQCYNNGVNYICSIVLVLKLKFWYQLLTFCYLIFNMIEHQNCMHRLSSRWLKPGVKHYKKENFVSVSCDAIMMKLGQIIDFDKRKNLQEISVFSHNLCVFFRVVLKSLL